MLADYFLTIALYIFYIVSKFVWVFVIQFIKMSLLELQSEKDTTPLHQQFPAGLAFLVGETNLLHMLYQDTPVFCYSVWAESSAYSACC